MTRREALRRRRQEGQVVPLFLFGLVTFVMLLVMILNTGQEVVRRTEVQNAADAAAMTQASWAARSLNLVAMNQVALTQSFTISVASAALAQVIAEAQIETAQVLYKLAPACITVIGCAPFAHVAATVELPLLTLMGKSPVARSRDFKRLAIAMEDMNAHLASDFPRFTRQVAADVADVNRVDPPLFHPGDRGSNGRATPLPIEKTAVLGLELPPFGPFPLCTAAEDGTSMRVRGNFDERQRGYAPYEAADEDLGGILALNAALTNLSPYGLFMGSYRKKYSLPKTHILGDNAATRTFENIWERYCMTQMAPVVPPTGLVSFPMLPVVELYKVSERPLLPLPAFLTPQSTRDAMSLLAFTRRRSNAAILPDRFAKPEAASYAYAQGEVYSEGGTYDLFTQDWKARLVPAGLLEREHTQAQRAVAAWPGLQTFLAAIDRSEWESVNAH